MSDYLTNDDLKRARGLHAESIMALENSRCYESARLAITDPEGQDNVDDLRIAQLTELLVSIAHSLAAQNAITLGSR